MAQPPQKENKEAQQRQCLAEMIDVVNRNAFYMKIAIDGKKMSEALNHALAMLNELRTNILPPNLYYELYQVVSEELGTLEDFFVLMHEHGEPCDKLYQRVQHCGNILPRLYLLITVGSACIRVGQAHANAILDDLVEMVKGIQHPMRGLFIRSYLLQISKDKLPENEHDYESFGGTINEAVEFLLQNFKEMNSLWVRMQHHSIIRNRKIRAKVREQLKMLVCKGLERISSLENLSCDIYEKTILPRVLEIVIESQESLSQQTLMEIVVQVFPDDFQLKTLAPYLSTISRLVDDVNTNNILISLMERLGGKAEREPLSLPRDIDVFGLFRTHIQAVVDSRKGLTSQNILELFESFLDFTVKYYHDNAEYVDNILKLTMDELQKRLEGSKLDSASIKILVRVLIVPLDELVLHVLNLKNFSGLMSFLPFKQRKKVSTKLLKSVLSHTTHIDSRAVMQPLLSFISPLVKDEEDSPEPEGTPEEEELFEKEQKMVASLVALIHNDNPNVHFDTLFHVRKIFGMGGDKRIKFTLVPVVFNAMKLAGRVVQFEKRGEDAGVTSKKIYQYLYECCTGLASSHPVMALRLFLQVALASDHCGFKEYAYEFMTQVFILYEEHMVESKIQVETMREIIGTLAMMRNIDAENRLNLVRRATQFSAKMLKKQDQCQLIYLCSHLFWDRSAITPENNSSIKECLQKSLKIADMCVPAACELFVDLLDQYVYYFEQGCDAIRVSYLKGLLELINEHMTNMESGSEKSSINTHFTNTVNHIRYRLQNGLTPAYAELFQ